MKLSLLLGLSIITVLSPIASRAEIAAEHHKLCLEARDYAGCIKAMQGEITENPGAEKCWFRNQQQECIAQKGVDHFGLPKLEGTIYRIYDSGMIVYFEWDGSRLAEDGYPTPNLYLIPHKGQERYTGLRANMRLISTITSQVESLPSVFVYDCKDKTYAWHVLAPNYSRNWEKLKGENAKTCSEFDFNSMPILRMKL